MKKLVKYATIGLTGAAAVSTVVAPTVISTVMKSDEYNRFVVNTIGDKAFYLPSAVKGKNIGFNSIDEVMNYVLGNEGSSVSSQQFIGEFNDAVDPVYNKVNEGAIGKKILPYSKDKVSPAYKTSDGELVDNARQATKSYLQKITLRYKDIVGNIHQSYAEAVEANNLYQKNQTVGVSFYRIEDKVNNKIYNINPLNERDIDFFKKIAIRNLSKDGTFTFERVIGSDAGQVDNTNLFRKVSLESKIDTIFDVLKILNKYHNAFKYNIDAKLANNQMIIEANGKINLNMCWRGGALVKPSSVSWFDTQYDKVSCNQGNPQHKDIGRYLMYVDGKKENVVEFNDISSAQFLDVAQPFLLPDVFKRSLTRKSWAERDLVNRPLPMPSWIMISSRPDWRGTKMGDIKIEKGRSVMYRSSMMYMVRDGYAWDTWDSDGYAAYLQRDTPGWNYEMQVLGKKINLNVDVDALDTTFRHDGRHTLTAFDEHSVNIYNYNIFAIEPKDYFGSYRPENHVPGDIVGSRPGRSSYGLTRDSFQPSRPGGGGSVEIPKPQPSFEDIAYALPKSLPEIRMMEDTTIGEAEVSWANYWPKHYLKNYTGDKWDKMQSQKPEKSSNTISESTSQYVDRQAADDSDFYQHIDRYIIDHEKNGDKHNTYNSSTHEHDHHNHDHGHNHEHDMQMFNQTGVNPEVDSPALFEWKPEGYDEVSNRKQKTATFMVSVAANIDSKWESKFESIANEIANVVFKNLIFKNNATAEYFKKDKQKLIKMVIDASKRFVRDFFDTSKTPRYYGFGQSPNEIIVDIDPFLNEDNKAMSLKDASSHYWVRDLLDKNSFSNLLNSSSDVFFGGQHDELLYNNAIMIKYNNVPVFMIKDATLIDPKFFRYSWVNQADVLQTWMNDTQKYDPKKLINISGRIKFIDEIGSYGLTTNAVDLTTPDYDFGFEIPNQKLLPLLVTDIFSVDELKRFHNLMPSDQDIIDIRGNDTGIEAAIFNYNQNILKILQQGDASTLYFKSISDKDLIQFDQDSDESTHDPNVLRLYRPDGAHGPSMNFLQDQPLQTYYGEIRSVLGTFNPSIYDKNIIVYEQQKSSIISHFKPEEVPMANINGVEYVLALLANPSAENWSGDIETLKHNATMNLLKYMRPDKDYVFYKPDEVGSDKKIVKNDIRTLISYKLNVGLLDPAIFNGNQPRLNLAFLDRESANTFFKKKIEYFATVR